MKRSAPFLFLLAACSSSVEARQIAVSSDAVRACELVVEDAQPFDVKFEGVDGVAIREAPHTAISFKAKSNGPIPSGAIRVEGPGAPKITRSRCFDVNGLELQGATARIEG